MRTHQLPGDTRMLRSALAATVLSLAALPVGAQTITIHAARLLDGKGGIVRDAVVTVEAGKITKVGSGGAASATYDLGAMTILPGIIVAHDHLSWYFNRQGRYHTPRDGDTPVQSMLSM